MQLVFVTVVLLGVLCVWVRGHSSLPGKHWFVLTSLAMSWWLLSVALELSTHAPDCVLTIGQVAWLGIVLLPTFWAFFLYEYALGAKVPRPVLVTCTYIAPALIVGAAATTHWHLAFYGPETRLVTEVAKPYVYFDHGPLFFAAISYLYVVIMSAIVITGRAVLRANPAVRSFFLKLFAGTMIPVVANLSYLIEDFRLFGSDPTPFSFALSLALVVWLIADNRWVDTNAIARELMFYNSSDPVFVLDPEGRVIETNPAATTLLAVVKPGRLACPAFPSLGLCCAPCRGGNLCRRGPMSTWMRGISRCARMRFPSARGRNSSAGPWRSWM